MKRKSSQIFKNLMILFLIIGASMSSYAQDKGLKGGLTLTTVNGQDYSSIKPGIQIGVFKQFGAAENPFVQIELLITQKGSWNWDSENRRNINLYYLDLPIMFGIDLGEKLLLNLGFQPSLFLGGSFKYTNAEGQEEKVSLRGEVASMDYSTLFGLEYEWDDHLTLGLRYNHSFVPLQTYENDFADNQKLPFSLVLQAYARFKLEQIPSVRSIFQKE